MKKSERAVLAVVVVVVVLTGIVSVVVSLRREAISAREPLTLEEIDQLANRMWPVEDLRRAKAESATDPESMETVSTPSPLPTRLARTLSPEELAEKFRESGKFGKQQEIAVGGMKAIESMLRIFGTEREACIWALDIGQELMKTGECDAARRYLYEALDPPVAYYYFKVCARLAWLEKDPENAARLLELSCEDKYGWMSDAVERKRVTGHDYGADHYIERLSNAVELSRATGSDALADHYLERLRAADLEAARYFEEESERND